MIRVGDGIENLGYSDFYTKIYNVNWTFNVDFNKKKKVVSWLTNIITQLYIQPQPSLLTLNVLEVWKITRKALNR